MSDDVLVVAKGDFAAVVVTPTFKEYSFEVITSLNRPIFEAVLKALHRIYKVASVTPTIIETSSSLNIDSIQAIGFNCVTYSFILERNNQWMCARNLITELNEFYIRESAKLILSNRLIGIGSDTPQYTHAVVEWFNTLDFYNSPASTPKPSISKWDMKTLMNVAIQEPEEIITVKGGAKLVVKAKKPVQKKEELQKKEEKKSGLKVHKGVGSLGSRLAQYV